MNTESNQTYRLSKHWLWWPGFVFAVYTHGYYKQEVLLQEINKKQALQDQEIASLNKLHRQAQHKLITREFEVQFEQESQQQTRLFMAQQQELLNELETELAFYRSIVAPEKTEQGIQIHEFALGETLNERQFDYRLRLAQFQTQQTRVKGKVAITLHGQYQGKSMHWPLPLNAERQSSLSFDFNYFTEFVGEIALPKEALPERLVVKIERQSFKTGKTLERKESSYALTELLSANALARLENDDLVALHNRSTKLE